MASRSILARFTSVEERQIYSSHAMERYLYLGTGPDGLVYRTLDGFGYSEFYKTGENYVMAIADYGNALFVGTSPNGRIMMHNFNTGNRFHYVTTGDYQVTSLVVHDDKLYAGTSPSGLILSFDGNTWTMEYDSYGAGIVALVSLGESLYVFVEGVEFIPELSLDGWGFLESDGKKFSVASFSKVTTDLSILQKNQNFDHSFSCAAAIGSNLYFAPENRCNLYVFDGSKVTIAQQWHGTKIRAIEAIGSDQLAVSVDDLVYVADLS